MKAFLLNNYKTCLEHFVSIPTTFIATYIFQKWELVFCIMKKRNILISKLFYAFLYYEFNQILLKNQEQSYD